MTPESKPAAEPRCSVCGSWVKKPEDLAKLERWLDDVKKRVKVREDELNRTLTEKAMLEERIARAKAQLSTMTKHRTLGCK